MVTVTITSREYDRLRQYKHAYTRLSRAIKYPSAECKYDDKYLDKLTKCALAEYKSGKCIKANSIDKALLKFES